MAAVGGDAATMVEEEEEGRVGRRLFLCESSQIWPFCPMRLEYVGIVSDRILIFDRR